MPDVEVCPVDSYLQFAHKWFDKNFTFKGLIGLAMLLYSGIPDSIARNAFWKEKWHLISAFLLTPIGRVVLIFLGIAVIWLDHRSVGKRLSSKRSQKEPEANPTKPQDDLAFEALKAMAEEDSENMSKRLILCGTSAKCHFFDAVDPYIDVTFKLVNASLFNIMSERVEGNATYLGYSRERHPFSTTPQIENSPFTLSRAKLGELKLRQFVPSGLTDNIASGGGKIKIDFSSVLFWFVFPGTGTHSHFCWAGYEVEVQFPD